MRIFSPDELDVMAKAYGRVMDQLSRERPSIEVIRGLVHEIGEAVANGLRDEDALAAAVLRRSRIDALP